MSNDGEIKDLNGRAVEAIRQAEMIRAPYEGQIENMIGEEEARYNALLDEADTLRAKANMLRREEKLREWRDEPEQPLKFPTGDGGSGGSRRGGSPQPAEDATAKAHQRAFQKFLRAGLKGLTPTEEKALQADNPVGGGFLVAPMQFVQDLLANVKDQVYIRNFATTYTIDRAESIGVPTLDTDVADSDWTTELAVGSEDTALAFGKRELKPNPVAKYVRVSNKLLRQASVDPEAVVRDRLSYKFAITEEKAFLLGTGANQPLGVFVASALGISTARDTTAAGSGTITADDLINVKHDLKPQYWPRARWIIAREVLKTIRKLKDTTNNYIWATGLGPGGGLQGNPSTILDLPYHVSEYAPGSVATGLYTAILGDFSFYWIADALDLQVQVVDQLYALTNQTAFIARKETDGMPVLEEPFRRLKMA